jgi:cytohesin
MLDAVESGNVDLVLALIEAGSGCTSARDNRKQQPLHIAARGVGVVLMTCYTRLVQVLCDAGANVSATDLFGKTPLHHAAQSGHVAAIELLSEAGANVEAVDDWGRTALHYAAAFGHVSVVKVLLRSGAKRSPVDKIGQAPVDYAMRRERVHVVSLLATDHQLPLPKQMGRAFLLESEI